MAVASHDRGTYSTLTAFLSQVHPVFMVPPLAISVFGGILAGDLEPVPGGFHLIAIFAAVYTAHVTDGLVDFYLRGEDDGHPLTKFGCRIAILGAGCLFVIALGGLWITAGWMATLITVPTWLIGYFHAPQLDMHPIGATAGYPVGVALALLGGYTAQSSVITPTPVLYSIVFLVLLIGVKIIDDAVDVSYDRSIGKRTVAALIGPTRARWLAYGCFGLALLSTSVLSVAGLMPTTSVLAVLAFGLVSTIAFFAPPKTATMLLIRGAYVFLAMLVAALWYHPLQ